MPNHVEVALTEAADWFENSLTSDATRDEFAALLANGQKPFVVRLLRTLPGYAVTIQVDKEPS